MTVIHRISATVLTLIGIALLAFAILRSEVTAGQMTNTDAIGFSASVLVLLAFCMKDIVSLRTIALGSNIAFLIYGLSLGLAPVWVLHAILAPINVWRLYQAVIPPAGAQVVRERSGIAKPSTYASGRRLTPATKTVAAESLLAVLVAAILALGLITVQHQSGFTGDMALSANIIDRGVADVPNFGGP
jgi:hypothetical protein